jgi:hypothetical protein
MKKIIIILILILSNSAFSQNSQIKPYVDYLKKTEYKSAKDFILQKFQDHDIVILCERHHDDLSQYELIKEILSDDYFRKNVKNLFTEIGIVNLQPKITKFLQATDLNKKDVEKKLVEFQRNADFWSIWANSNYHFLLRTIYDLNNNSNNKINYFPSDVEFDWSKVKDSADFYREMEVETEPRDSIMAYNIINRYEKFKSPENKKALVIMNYRHAFKIHSVSKGGLNRNTGKYLTDYFGNRATSILIHQTIFVRKEKEHIPSLIQDGKWDATFKYLEIDNIGFDFKNNVFGKDNLDMWDINSHYKYKDAFDGYIFYKPIEAFNIVSGVKGLIPKDYEAEFLRRFKISLTYQKRHSLLKKLDDEKFRQAIIKEINEKRVKKYPSIEALIETRDKYLND